MREWARYSSLKDFYPPITRDHILSRHLPIPWSDDAFPRSLESRIIGIPLYLRTRKIAELVPKPSIQVCSQQYHDHSVVCGGGSMAPIKTMVHGHWGSVGVALPRLLLCVSSL